MFAIVSRIHFACAWHLSHISTPKVPVSCCAPTLIVCGEPPLTALPTLGGVASMMGTRSPNMCEASRHASDQAFVCSYEQLMVCRQVGRMTDEPPARQTTSVSFIALALPTEAGIILKTYIQINGDAFVLKCAPIPSRPSGRFCKSLFHGSEAVAWWRKRRHRHKRPIDR